MSLLRQSNGMGRLVTRNAPSLCLFFRPAFHSPILHFLSLDSHFLNEVPTQFCFTGELKQQ